MRLRPSFFENGMEVDCLARYENRKRLSIRRPGSGQYEVYTFDYLAHKEEVLHQGTLEDCVAYTNAITGFDDVVDRG